MFNWTVCGDSIYEKKNESAIIIQNFMKNQYRIIKKRKIKLKWINLFNKLKEKSLVINLVTDEDNDKEEYSDSEYVPSEEYSADDNDDDDDDDNDNDNDNNDDDDDDDDNNTTSIFDDILNGIYSLFTTQEQCYEDENEDENEDEDEDENEDEDEDENEEYSEDEDDMNEEYSENDEEEEEEEDDEEYSSDEDDDTVSIPRKQKNKQKYINNSLCNMFTVNQQVLIIYSNDYVEKNKNEQFIYMGIVVHIRKRLLAIQSNSKTYTFRIESILDKNTVLGNTYANNCNELNNVRISTLNQLGNNEEKEYTFKNSSQVCVLYGEEYANKTNYSTSVFVGKITNRIKHENKNTYELEIDFGDYGVFYYSNEHYLSSLERNLFRDDDGWVSKIIPLSYNYDENSFSEKLIYNKYFSNKVLDALWYITVYVTFINIIPILYKN